jgi:hypothetical protein
LFATAAFAGQKETRTTEMMTNVHNTWALARTALADVGSGIIAVAHNTFTLVGFAAVLVAALVLGRPENRAQAEQQLLGWLQARNAPAAVADAELDALESGAANGLVLQASLDDLPTQQKRVAEWLSRRYRIAPDPMAHMVAAAYETAAALKLDPTLVLAVAAIESSFNPFVQSPVGAQGLMQVMSNVHEEKFERFGGTEAAFDPVTSIKVGAVILKEYVNRAGSPEGGLKMYVGAANMEGDGGYGNKVLAERMRIQMVAAGKRVSPMSTQPMQLMPVSAPGVPAAVPAVPAAQPSADAPEAVKPQAAHGGDAAPVRVATAS